MAVCIAANIATDVLTSSTSLKETQEAWSDQMKILFSDTS